jgi:hypothetical protein
MGDDPERMDDDAVIAARPVQRATIRNDAGGRRLPVPGLPQAAALPVSRWELLRSSLAGPGWC